MNKRYAHTILTFKAWDTVMRELIELRERHPQQEIIQECIESVRIIWANRDELETL